MHPIPRGYRGVSHETIGSDILSVVDVVQFPQQLLGQEIAARLTQLKPEEWYPVEWLLEALEILALRLGTSGLRRIGRRLFELTHEAHVKQVAHSAADVILGFDGMYHKANRGTDIGGWRLLRFIPGRAELEKTTPHHCAMEEGIFAQALSAMGIPAHVFQEKCLRKGADACHFVITSPEVGPLWTGGREPMP